MEKEAGSPKTKNLSKPKPDGLKPKAVTQKKTPRVEKEINPSRPKPDGLN